MNKQRENNQKLLKQYNESLGLDPGDRTMDPWASASADTGNGVLQASAIVSAGDREAAMRTPFIQVPTQQQTQGSGNSTLMASSLSGPSASEMTPGWLLNSVLS